MGRSFVVSAQEPKAQVSYCHHAPSVVCRPSVVRRRRRPSVNFSHFQFFRKNRLIDFDRDEVLMVPHKCWCFSARSTQGRIQGGAKIGHGGYLPLANLFFRPEGYSDKPNAQKWSKSMWEDVFLFLVPFQNQIFDAFLTSFWTWSIWHIFMQFLWSMMW